MVALTVCAASAKPPRACPLKSRGRWQPTVQRSTSDSMANGARGKMSTPSMPHARGRTHPVRRTTRAEWRCSFTKRGLNTVGSERSTTLLRRRRWTSRLSLLPAARDLYPLLVLWMVQEPLSRHLPCPLLRGRRLQRAPYQAANVFLCFLHLLLRSLGDLALLAVERVSSRIVKGYALLPLLGMVTPVVVRRNAT